MNTLVEWLLSAIGSMGYSGIFLLMAMESSIFPVPSELVMPPAGYLAQQGQLHIWLVIACGTLGSLVGAYANYYAARFLGRPLILRYGRYVGLSAEKFFRIEAFFLRHGEISTFVGRLLPVIRHFISLPAGMAGMNHLRFSFYTLLGAGIWCSVLTWIGYVIGENKEIVLRYSHVALWAILACCTIILGCYVFFQKRKALAQPRS